MGFAEGAAIAYGWRGIATPRPLTHELLSDLLDRHGVEVAALRITVQQGSLFLAELDTTGPRGLQVVPCRPSDGIALVLRRRMATPITVAEGLFEPAPTFEPAVAAPVTPAAEAAAEAPAESPADEPAESPAEAPAQSPAE